MTPIIVWVSCGSALVAIDLSVVQVVLERLRFRIMSEVRRHCCTAAEEASWLGRKACSEALCALGTRPMQDKATAM